MDDSDFILIDLRITMAKEDASTMVVEGYNRVPQKYCSTGGQSLTLADVVDAEISVPFSNSITTGPTIFHTELRDSPLAPPDQTDLLRVLTASKAVRFP
jgi:hypothetical protein